MIRILLLCCLVILSSCAKTGYDEKIYKTTVHDVGLQVLSDPDSSSVILRIPFKSKVELIDNKPVFSERKNNYYVKVRYKDTTGYVLSEYLSDKDDIPFVENIKFDYRLEEFPYDRTSVINAVRNVIDKRKDRDDLILKYYIDDPQIFTFYGKDCDNIEIKKVAVMVMSKLHRNFSMSMDFVVVDNKLTIISTGTGYWGSDENTLKEMLDYLKLPDECCDRGCD